MGVTYSSNFLSLIDDVAKVSFEIHADVLIRHARLNLPDSTSSMKQLPSLEAEKQKSGILISAGPSVHRKGSIKKILQSGYKGTIVAVDGAYIACLKAGLIPDFVVTLDPHPTRIVRWFGDHHFEEHTKSDDYFARQDLDIEFRKNTIEQNKQHIELVNKYGHLSKAIVASSAPCNVVERIKEAKMQAFWWNPLVDDPRQAGSITRQLYEINKLPCMNTGGNVGAAAWVFANSILKLRSIGLVGMDFGYYSDTPLEKTQRYYELIERLGGNDGIEQCFVHYEFPLTKERFYIDPIYFWYRKNFLELLKKSSSKTYNCTEGGTLFGEEVECVTLYSFLEFARKG